MCIFVGCLLAFDHFTVHVCIRAKVHWVCVCACVVLGWGVVVLEQGGGCDRQRSHLTLHILNRLKEFFPRFCLCPLLPEAEWGLVRIIKIDDIEWQRHDFCLQQEASEDSVTKLSCHRFSVLHDCFTLMNWMQVNTLYWIKVLYQSGNSRLFSFDGSCPFMTLFNG